MLGKSKKAPNRGLQHDDNKMIGKFVSGIKYRGIE